MKLNLFQYAVLLHPKKNKDGYDDNTELLVEPTTMLAKDDKQAGIKIARQIPEGHLDSLDRVEILVRPF